MLLMVAISTCTLCGAGASAQTASVTHLPADLPPPAGATAVRRRDTCYFSRKFSVIKPDAVVHGKTDEIIMKVRETTGDF